MKRRGFLWFGLALCILCLPFLIYNSIITGNVIGNNLADKSLSIIGLTIFLTGLLIAISGDALQKYLGRKEQESPSPSLKDKKQTTKERMHFFKRGLLERILVRRNKKTQREIEEERRDNYEGKLSPEQIIKAKTWEYDKKKDDERKSKCERDITRLRNGLSSKDSETLYLRRDDNLLTQFKKIKERLSNRSFAPERKDISYVLDNIEDIYKRMGMKFSRERYEDFLKKKGIEGANKILNQLEEDITSNRYQIRGETISNEIKNASSWLRLGKQEFSEENKIYMDLLEKYVREAKTIPVSEATKKYNITVIHGVPYRTDSSGNYPQFYNNDYWRGRNAQGREKEMNLEMFIDKLFKEKPDISASMIRKNSSVEEFFSPYGVIIKEGKIYDANPEDMASQGHSIKNLVRMGLKGMNASIDERVRATATRVPRGQSHNEAIIGDNHQIGGIYFVEDHKLWHLSYEGGKPEIIQRLAKEAIKYNVPFYTFKEGQGFIELNPRDYLEEESIQQRRAYTRHNKKTTKTSKRRNKDLV